MQLKYQQNQQLEQVKNEIEEYRNMLLKDKWQQESQQLKNEIDEQKKKKNCSYQTCDSQDQNR